MVRNVHGTNSLWNEKSGNRIQYTYNWYRDIWKITSIFDTDASILNTEKYKLSTVRYWNFNCVRNIYANHTLVTIKLQILILGFCWNLEHWPWLFETRLIIALSTCHSNIFACIGSMWKPQRGTVNSRTPICWWLRYDRFDALINETHFGFLSAFTLIANNNAVLNSWQNGKYRKTKLVSRHSKYVMANKLQILTWTRKLCYSKDDRAMRSI